MYIEMFNILIIVKYKILEGFSDLVVFNYLLL